MCIRDSPQHQRRVGDVERQVNCLVPRPRQQTVLHLNHHLPQVKEVLRQLKLARFEPRQIEQVVDQARHAPGLVEDRLGRAAAFVGCVSRAVQQRLTPAGDGR